MVAETVKFQVHQAQPKVWNKLVRTYQANRVESAYLFAGPKGSGKEGLALEFAIFLNCEKPTDTACGICPECARFKSLQHEHLKIVVPLPTGSKSSVNDDPLASLKKDDLEFLTNAIQKKAENPFHKISVPRANRILINSIRELRKSLYLKSQIQGQKIVLIFDAHLLSVGQGETANALLKMLEEPPQKTTLILVTDHKYDLLPTILSRCQHIDFPPLDSEVIESYLEKKSIDPNSAKFIAGLAQGNMHRALSLAERSTEDILALIKNLSHSVSTENGQEWRNFINRYSRMAFSAPEDFRFHIYLMQLWFRSSYRLRRGLSDELHLKELIADLQSFNSQYPGANLHRIDTMLEQIIDEQAHNRYMPLTLTNFLIGMQKELNGIQSYV